ncbi:MAG: ECF transporter S component [Candidatus Diapherotrites archaeon]|nr:ECF transporter S component [Candidatus Diapherotrites archaeon]
MNRTRLLVTAGMLGALSLALEFTPLFYKFGDIKIDLVGVPWVLAALLLGLAGGVVTSVVTALLMALLTPTGWIGALMKFLATAPMVIILGLVIRKFGVKLKPLLAGFAVALVARCAGMLFFNYYFAMPVFWNLPVEAALQYPAALLVIPNAALSVIEFAGAYLLVFRTRLRERLNA